MNVTPAEAAMLAARASAPLKEGWRDGALSVWVPGRPKNVKNAGHWRTRHRWTSEWRDRAATRIIAHARRPGVTGYIIVTRWPWAPFEPKAITFTVYTSGRGFDGPDNLRTVCWPVLDALGPARTYHRGGVEVRGHGVGLIDDDKNPAHDIQYLQVVKAKVPGIALTVRLRRTQEENRQ